MSAAYQPFLHTSPTPWASTTMPSRSRSHKSSRSSAKSSFGSASILVQPLDTPSPSNTGSQDEIELVTRTSQPCPSDPQSPPAGSATFARTNLVASTPGNTAPASDPPLESHSQGESAGVHINTQATACGQHDRRGQPAQGGFPMNYKQKYPEDPIYKETEENARVFHVYNDESKILDNDMIIESSDNLDILLVFVHITFLHFLENAEVLQAGLFASVLTTFVAQTSQSLSPDKTDISNSLLHELVSLQRALENGTSFTSIPPASTSFTPSRSDIWVNSLLFISLSLSLSAALLAVIAKQWLRQYTSFISGSPRERALIRQFRYDGLEKWGVRLIIGFLPTILYVSLFLFMAGLIVLLLPLNNALGCTVAGIAGFLCATYIITNSLPVIFIQCPYRTPLSEIMNSVCGGVRMAFEVIWSLGVVLLAHGKVIYDMYAWIPDWVLVYRQDGVIRWPVPLKDIERARANEGDKWGRPLGIDGALTWLAQTTLDMSVKAIVAEAAGSVSHPSLILYNIVEQQWEIVSRQGIRDGELLGAGDERNIERLMRGAALVQYVLPFDVLPTDVQDYSTLLAFAGTYYCTVRFHGGGGGGVKLMTSHLVLSLVLEQPETWEVFEAPTWLWWVVCKQAELGEGEALEQQEVTDFCMSGSMDVGVPGEFLERLRIPSTLRHAVRERMIETYGRYVRVQRPVSPRTLSRASEFYVTARYEFEQNPPAPFATVSLVTFFADNFARCMDFWAG